MRTKIDVHELYEEYVFGKQTLRQLSVKHGISVSSIQRTLKSAQSECMVSSKKKVVVLMDTTYWGWNFGVVVMKDWRTGKILWRKFINKKETLSDYKEGEEWLLSHDFRIDGIVCDGLRGMFQMFAEYRMQMCQFHQIKIVKRYLTNAPKLPAAIELWNIVKLMCHTDKESFMATFNQWSEDWGDFLKERTTDAKTGKTHYAHRRLSSAYLSLKRNMPHLWTFYDYSVAGIPNTNNALEGQFTDLKTKLRNHNGLSIRQRKKFIDMYFMRKY